MTDTSPKAVADHLNISVNHEAGLIPMATQIFIRAQAKRIAELELQAKVTTERERELAGHKWAAQHTDTMNDAVAQGMVIDEQAARIKELEAEREDE